MKRHLNSTILILLLALFSCSSDDNEIKDSFSGIDKVKFISENSNSFFSEEIDYYTYTDDGLLLNLTGGRFLSGSYEYDENRKLISKTKEAKSFTYEYDTQGRIIKQKTVGSNDYILLKFENNKVISEKFYGDPMTSGILEKKELTLNSEGLIIKVESLEKVSIRFQPNEIREELFPFYGEITYEYDSRGNIIKIITDGITENLTYDNSINPFYITFKKHYEINYYIDNYFGLRVYQSTGLSPNNLKTQGIRTINYVYDSDNYPISWTTELSVQGAGVAEQFIKYKE